MKTIPFALVVAFFLLSLLPAQAEIEVVTFRLDNNAVPSFTVPAGKVFFLEWHARDQSAQKGSPEEILLNLGGGSINLYGFSDPPSNSTAATIFARPLKMPEGSVILVTDIPSVPVNEVARILGGMLVDAADIYATTIPSQFGNVMVVGATLNGTLKQSSPRPTVVKVETSTDLKTWTPDATAAVKSTADKTEKVITVAANAPAKYVRAKVIARAND